MMMESSALLRFVCDSAKFSVGTAPVPHWEGCAGAVTTGGGAAVIPAKIPPEQQAAAWEFLSWLISTQQTADFSCATGYVPVRESAHVLLRNQGFYIKNPEYETAVEQLKLAREAPQLPQWRKAWPIIAKAMKSVLEEDAPADKKLKAAEASVQPFLNVKPK
jgi:sn-glycerol 3-phosphate transport system substrate-binding protein